MSSRVVHPVGVTVAPMTQGFGAVVQPTGGRPSLDDAPIASIRRLYETRGAVLVRGFDGDIPRFDRVACQFIGEPIVNGNAARDDVAAEREIQTVNSGDAAIPLHAEMAYSPLRPDVLCFYCLQPPAPHTGETLLCDGVELWDALAPHLRATFDGATIRYRFRRSRTMAAQFDGHSARLAADVRLETFRVHDDGTADVDFVTAAVEPVRYGSARAFANSVIVERDSASIDGIGPIDLATRQELFAASVGLSHRVAWQSGDLLLVDNSRVMHGRRRIVPNDGRRIAIKMGWAPGQA